MFVNAAEVSFEAYDVLIVGSGPAGVTLAKRLETHGKKSLIIETGAEDFEGDLQDHYSKVYAHGHYGEDHWGLHWIRAFGGTSAVWGGGAHRSRRATWQPGRSRRRSLISITRRRHRYLGVPRIS